MAETGEEVPISQPESSKGMMTRRTFVKGAAAVVIGAVIGGMGGAKTNEAIQTSDKEDKTFEINGVKGTYEVFNPVGKENFDRTKAVIYLPGWPWSANEEATKEFPRRLANNFGFRCFNIDTKTPQENPEYLAKQAQATLEFLKKNNIKEATIAGHSVGAIKAAYLEVAAQNDTDFKVKGVVIANTRGLDKIGLGELIRRFIKDAFVIGKEYRKKLRKKDIPDPSDRVIQGGLTDSILRGIKERGGFIPLLLEQVRTLTQVDPIFGKIKAPVLVLVSEADMVSEYRRYMQDEKVMEHMEPEPSGAVLSKQAEVKNKTGDVGFFRKYLNALKNRINMARWSKGREKFLGKEVFKSAENVKVLRSERIGDHNAVPGPQSERAAHISSKMFDRMKRAPKS